MYNDFSLGRLIRIIWRHLFVILVIAFVGGCTGFAYRTFFIDNVYSSSVKLYVDTSDSTMNESLQQAYATNAVDSYIAMFNSTRFYTLVSEATDPENGGYDVTDTVTDEDGNETTVVIDRIEPAGRSYSPLKISTMTSYSTVNDTEIFKITITSRHKDDTKLIANACAKLANSYIGDIKSNASVSIVDTASEPVVANANRAFLSVVFAFLAAVVATVIFVVIDLSDISIKTEEDLSSAHKYPVLGTIPNFNIENQSKKGRYGYKYKYGYGKGYSAYKHYVYGNYYTAPDAKNTEEGEN
ncbi:MAG: hypothetical protein II982_00660 [Clostridia bacterium]|nr:hypothetical protein [Clostridia bacterium]